MTKTFTPSRPIWCAGCGDFGVLHALIGGFEELGVPEHERFVVAGIGCSGTLQNNLSCYGYHTLHGRVLPTFIKKHNENSFEHPRSSRE